MTASSASRTVRSRRAIALLPGEGQRGQAELSEHLLGHGGGRRGNRAGSVGGRQRDPGVGDRLADRVHPQAEQPVRRLGHGDRVDLQAAGPGGDPQRPVQEDVEVRTQPPGPGGEVLGQPSGRDPGQDRLVEVLAQFLLAGRRPARRGGAGEPADDPAHVLEPGPLRVRLAAGDELLERGPAEQPVLAGDGELRVVQGGKLTGHQTASGLQLEEAEAGLTGERT